MSCDVGWTVDTRRQILTLPGASFGLGPALATFLFNKSLFNPHLFNFGSAIHQPLRPSLFLDTFVGDIYKPPLPVLCELGRGYLVEGWNLVTPTEDFVPRPNSWNYYYSAKCVLRLRDAQRK